MFCISKFSCLLAVCTHSVMQRGQSPNEQSFTPTEQSGPPQMGGVSNCLVSVWNVLAAPLRPSTSHSNSLQTNRYTTVRFLVLDLSFPIWREKSCRKTMWEGWLCKFGKQTKPPDVSVAPNLIVRDVKQSVLVVIVIFKRGSRCRCGGGGAPCIRSSSWSRPLAVR